jgi:hypothetical protein
LEPAAIERPVGRSRRTVNLSSAAAALSITAALLHVWMMPMHFLEWWGYGAFFLGTALCQAACGILLLRVTGRVLPVLGILVNGALVVLYVVTRTAGVPIFGPMVGVVEPLGFVDLLATIIELALISTLAALLDGAVRRHALHALIVAGAALWILRLTGILTD